MQDDVAQLVSRYDPLLARRKISVDPDKILPQQVAGKALGVCQIIIEADLHVHGAQEFERVAGPMPADQPGRFVIDVKSAHRAPPQSFPSAKE